MMYNMHVIHDQSQHTIKLELHFDDTTIPAELVITAQTLIAAIFICPKCEQPPVNHRRQNLPNGHTMFTHICPNGHTWHVQHHFIQETSQ